MKRKSLLMLGLVAMLAATNVIGVFAAENEGEGAKSNAVFAFDNDEEGEEGTTPPVDPEKPGEEIDPDDEDEDGDGGSTGNTGKLRIDYVSNFQFGAQAIESGNQVFEAALVKATEVSSGAEITVPNFVQVSDLRGTGAGWSLQVAQTSPFKVTDVKEGVDQNLIGRELKGATITIENILASTNNIDEDPVDAYDGVITLGTGLDAKTVLNADRGTGFGTHLGYFGKFRGQEGAAATAKNSVKLTVPGNTTKIEGTYKAELTWTLNDTPDSSFGQ